MPHDRVMVRTHDGECTCYVATPIGNGPWPAIFFFMDAGGIRPVMIEMVQRLADAGYLVLLPDLYYRHGQYGPLVPMEVFAGDTGAILGPLMATTDNDKAVSDTEALLALLDTRGDVAGLKVGAVGFCMGGGTAIAAAASYSSRFAAVASFHGGNLATDSPSSPHRLAPKLQAEVYVAAAESDDSYPPDMASRFEATLSQANIHYETRIYNAAHGWMVPDFPVHDPVAAERGWIEMFALLERNLRQQR